MASAGKIEVSEKSLVRAWQQGHCNEFWIQIETTDRDDLAFCRGLEAGGATDDEDGFAPRTNARSPKGYVALVWGADDADQLIVNAHRLAVALEQEGITGTLNGTKAATLPRWLKSGTTEPTVFMTWSYGAADLTDYPTATHPLWKLDAATTRTIAEFAWDFVEPAGGTKTLLSQGVFQFGVSDSPDTADLLAAAILSDDVQASLVRFNGRTRSGRSAALACTAQTVLQIMNEPDSWAERIDTLTAAMTAHAELLDHTFIRTTYQLIATGWQSTVTWQKAPSGRESAFRYNQHLTTSHVIDAHGVQVLTDTHLEHIHNLDHWNVRDLGHHRHLVTAPDLEHWYSTATPDPDVVEQARADFADILLTPETVEQHPPPWR